MGGGRDEGDSEMESNADKIAESPGLRGAVIMPEGGGRATAIGECIAGATVRSGGDSRLRCARGGNEVDSPYSY
jgi:hypothetical protein